MHGLAAQDTTTWLENNLSIRADEFRVHAEEAQIAYRAWGPPDADGLLFVHGGLAHARWWDHLAPALPDRRVVAIDLSGNGDSSHRAIYRIDQWADEIAAVARAAALKRPVVVGHSMGGVPSVAAAIRHSSLFKAVITVDTRFNDAGYPPRDKPSARFSSIEEGIEQFAPAHAATDAPIAEVLRRHLAETSLGADGDAWRWKRPDTLRIKSSSLRELLPRLELPLGVIRTDGGVVTPEAALEIQSLTAGASASVTIPASGHNPLLDQPIAFVAVLRTLLGAWLPALQGAGRPAEPLYRENH